MRILGIDYGLRKIGLAISEGVLAEPLLIISNPRKASPRGKQLSVIGKIAGICQKYGVEKIVIGLPEGKVATKVKGFGPKVAELTGLPVIYQDESLTSKEAVAKMIEAGKKRKDRQRLEDAIAAAIILQSYLDSQK